MCHTFCCSKKILTNWKNPHKPLASLALLVPAWSILTNFWKIFPQKYRHFKTLSGLPILTNGKKVSTEVWRMAQSPLSCPGLLASPTGLRLRTGLRCDSLPVFYYDQDSQYGQEKFICSACSLSQHFSLTLKGVCEFTLMGRRSLQTWLNLIVTLLRYNLCGLERQPTHHLFWLDIIEHTVGGRFLLWQHQLAWNQFLVKACTL